MGMAAPFVAEVRVGACGVAIAAAFAISGVAGGLSNASGANLRGEVLPLWRWTAPSVVVATINMAVDANARTSLVR